MNTWSAQQYSKFEAERNRPILDLLAHVTTAPVRTAADIGCGPGNSTELLRDHFADAEIYGMDSSPDMIEAARRRLPGVRFDVDDIAAWRDPGPFDVILSNAALQWVPDHAALLPMLLGKLAPGGSLAVQMPDNLGEPSHVLMRETALRGPWAGRLEGALATWANRLPAEAYYRILHGRVAAIDLWRTTYFHRLEGGAAAVVEWFKGSALGPFLEALDDGERGAFLAQYQAEIAKAYPPLADGSVILPFPRVFVIAVGK
jgi:trans-aconitate 2-methyltransferase